MFSTNTTVQTLRPILPSSGVHHFPLTIENLLEDFAHYLGISTRCLKRGRVNQLLQGYVAEYCDFVRYRIVRWCHFTAFALLLFLKGTSRGMLVHTLDIFDGLIPAWQVHIPKNFSYLWHPCPRYEAFLVCFLGIQSGQKISRLIHTEDTTISPFMHSKWQKVTHVIIWTPVFYNNHTSKLSTYF